MAAHRDERVLPVRQHDMPVHELLFLNRHQPELDAVAAKALRLRRRGGPACVAWPRRQVPARELAYRPQQCDDQVAA